VSIDTKYWRDMFVNVTPLPWLYRSKSNSWHKLPPEGTKYTYGDSIMDDDNDLAWRDQGYLEKAVNAVPSMLDEIDRLRGVLKEARSRVKEYQFQMSSYTIADEAKACVERIDAALVDGDGVGE